MRSPRVPSPALIVALIALVAALAGTAAALPGKSSIDKNDIKKNAVKSKNIKQEQVKSSDLADGTVAEADLKPAEASHLVGESGEPEFGDGGDGDCLWRNLVPADTGGVESGIGPLSFFKDPYGIVRLGGVAIVEDGPGGDGVCDAGDPGEEEDGVVFTLPAGYRPADVIYAVAGGGSLVAPDAGGSFSGVSIAPGAVFSPAAPLFGDMISFRAATPAAAAASAAGPVPQLDPEALRRLTR